MIMLIFALVLGVIAGYSLCAFATWQRVHRQESEIRALSTAISVMEDMGDYVPPEWVIAQLDSMVTKEFR
jgi:hypothetical protein